MNYLTYLWQQFKASSMLIKFTIITVLAIWVVAFGMALFAIFLLWERPAVAEPVTPGPIISSPSITLEPAAGPANTPVTISGQGWTPESTVLIYFTSSAASMPELGELAVESAVVDPTGRFIAVVPLATQPDWTVPGLVRVVVREAEGDAAAQAFFTLVDASVVITGTATPTPLPEPGTGPTVIPETPTTTPQPGTPQLTAVTDLNIRSGPGTSYPILGLLRANQSAEITGVSPDSRWWQINFSGTNEGRGWVAAQYVNAQNTANVPVVQTYPPLPTAAPLPQPTATRQPAPTPVVITDWRGEYYNNLTMSGSPVLVRNDVEIDFNWGTGSPANGIGSDNFSARWNRSIYFSAGTYRFTVRVDDGVLFWIDDRLIIDQWHDSSTASYSADVNLTEGSHNLKMAYYERTGDALAELRWERVNTYPDWKGEYYGNPNLSGAPLRVRNDPEIDFNWGTGSPASGLPSDNFSARWTRELYFPAGTYRFTVRVDDGARLWLDGNLVIDQWRDSSVNSYVVDVNLSEGSHTLRLEYYDRWYDAIVELDWQRQESYPDWKAEYFNNRHLDGNPVLVRNEDEIDHDWGSEDPAAEVPADNFSARWTRKAGFRTAPYIFEIVVDDGVRLWFDDTLLIDSWEDGSARRLQARLQVHEGQHRLRVEYYDRTGDAEIRVSWERDNTPENQPPQSIPGGPYTVAEGDQVLLDGRASYDPDGSIVKYEWDWNFDGSNFNARAEGPTVRHRYDDGPNTRAIALRVTDNDGASRVAASWVQIENVRPAVDANGPYQTQAGDSVTFSGTANDPSSADQSGLVYVWDFGDGQRGNGPVVTHVYDQGGNYEVKLTVTDKDGGRGTDTTTVEVSQTNQPPQAVISGPTVGQVGEPLQFSGRNSSDSDGRITAYRWNFGDGTTASGKDVSHSYQAPGSYEVRLLVKDNNDQTNSTTVFVKISEPVPDPQPPTAVISSTQRGIVGRPLTFRGGRSSDSDGQIVAYTWDFGDGTSANGPRVNHVYQQGGAYQVTLTVTDDQGLTNSATVLMQIKPAEQPATPPPVAIIDGPVTGLAGQPLTFKADRSSDNGQIVSYTWEMGDGSNITQGVNITHVYNRPGDYKVVLTVTDNEGLSTTAEMMVTISEGTPGGDPGPPPEKLRNE